MIYFSEKELDDLLSEDVPYYDLTTTILKLENKPARIYFTTREDAVVCCTEEVMRMFSKLSIRTTLFTPSGEFIEKGVKFLEGEGLSKNIHTVWRACENLISFSSGIATRTRKLVNAACEVNPDIIISTTRKIIPYTKKIAVKAVQSGGASVYRLGLSESILIFKNHFSFFGELNNLGKRLKEQKKFISGKLVAVQVKTQDEAMKAATEGVDIVQLERFEPDVITKVTKEIKKINPKLKVGATGGITIDNVKDFAATGVDILLTSWPYFAYPANIDAIITPINDQLWQV